MTVASIDTLSERHAPDYGQQLDLYLEGDGFFVVYDEKTNIIQEPEFGDRQRR
jgi:flagellar hook protein FlgE